MTNDSTEHPAPATDDPEVLRELLRQAHAQLDVHASFDQMMASNIARSQALPEEAVRNRQMPTPPATGPEIASTIQELREHLTGALASLDDLESRIVPAAPDASREADTQTSLQPTPEPTPSDASEDGPSIRTDLLIHNITSPTLARSAQAHLAGLPGVTRADVRELAEGLLRITVECSDTLTSNALSNWEPQRRRSLLTEHTGVLEIKLDDERK